MGLVAHAVGDSPAFDGVAGFFVAGDADVVVAVAVVAVGHEGGGAAYGVGEVVEESTYEVEDFMESFVVHVFGFLGGGGDGSRAPEDGLLVV